MSLSTNITNLATRIATEFKTVRSEVKGTVGDLNNLITTSKGNLVAAINETYTLAEGAAGGGAVIDDNNVSSSTTYSSEKIEERLSDVEVDLTDLIDDSSASSSTVYSSSKTDSQISAAVAGLVNSAPATLDTLKELADALGGDANFAATVSTALGNRVRVDEAQSFNGTQQAQARSNIGAASATDLTALSTNVGDTNADFVQTFEDGLEDA